MAKGTPDDPIEISDLSEATKNLTYIIRPGSKPKETADGETVQTQRNPGRR